MDRRPPSIKARPATAIKDVSLFFAKFVVNMGYQFVL